MASRITSGPQRQYGWNRDCHDSRDSRYEALEIAQYGHETLDECLEIDLRCNLPMVYDQGHLGSCTANALGACYEYAEIAQEYGRDEFRPSRLFLYFNERALEGTIKRDVGASIRDGMRVLNRIGVCSEEEWPYDVKKFSTRPPSSCYLNARRDRVLVYHRLPHDLKLMRHCLKVTGRPFVFGFRVFESFESKQVAETGFMRLPTSKEEVVGGHAVCAVGFSDERQCFLVRNSWGAAWGLEGHFWMPYEFMTNPKFTNDIWVIDAVSPHEAMMLTAHQPDGSIQLLIPSTPTSVTTATTCSSGHPTAHTPPASTSPTGVTTGSKQEQVPQGQKPGSPKGMVSSAEGCCTPCCGMGSWWECLLPLNDPPPKKLI